MRRVLFLLAALFALAVPAAANPAAADPGADIREIVSPAGLRAWLVTDRGVPVISVRFAFRGAGGAADPDGKAGLADMAAALLTEGAGEMDSQAFSRRLEDLSVDLSFEAGVERVSGALRTLTENRAQAFDLLRLALTRPRFDEDAVARVRRQILSHLSAQSQSPRRIAGRRWFAVMFGDHPYGRPLEGTPESVAAISADDLRGVLRRLARDNLVVSVVGDIGADEVGPLLDAAFADLPARADLPDIAPAAPGHGGTIVVPLDVPQSVVVFGQKGIARDDPDFYAAYLMNRILGGGGFTSRLSTEIREKRGLAYSVYSALVPRDTGSLILGGVATENARVGESLDLVRREWTRMRDEGVTEAELADAKSYSIGSYPLRFTSTGGIAAMLTAIQLDSLGIDYVDRRKALLSAVTVADIRRVARRLLDPDGLTVVVVGQPQGVDPG